MLTRNQEDEFYLIVGDILEEWIKPSNQEKGHKLGEELKEIIDIVIEDWISDNEIPEE